MNIQPTNFGPPTSPSIDTIIDRFLSWPMPEGFAPDCYITFDRERAKANNGWPIGTNLLTADQARAMFEHCLSDAGRSGCDAADPLIAREAHGEIIRVAAAMVRGEGCLSEYRADHDGMITKATLRSIAAQNDQFKQWAIRLRQAADKLVAALRAAQERIAELEDTQRKFGTIQHDLLCRAERAESLLQAERERAGRMRELLRELVEAEDAALEYVHDVNKRLKDFGSTTILCPSPAADRLNNAWRAARAALEDGQGADK